MPGIEVHPPLSLCFLGLVLLVEFLSEVFVLVPLLGVVREVTDPLVIWAPCRTYTNQLQRRHLILKLKNSDISKTKIYILNIYNPISMIRKNTRRCIIIDLRSIREPLLTTQIVDLVLKVIQQQLPEIIVLAILNVVLKLHLT